jgi:hypothetical protein
MKPVVLLGILAFFLGLGSMLIVFSLKNNQEITVLQLQQPCDLHVAACVAEDTAGHSIRFSLSPPTIPLMQALTATAELQGLGNVTSAQLTVEGVNMYMGYQYAELKASASTQALQGKFTLPVCSNEKMAWKATLTLNSPVNSVRAEFPFETIRR